MQQESCPLTNQKISLTQVDGRMSYFYSTKKTGGVIFTNVAWGEAGNLGVEDKAILTGICRNRTLKNQPPIEIKSTFLRELHAQEIPYGFQERCLHFLRHLYDQDGNQYKEFEIDAWTDSPITYSTQDEFERIMRCLEKEGFIEFLVLPVKARKIYQGVILTKAGILEVEKGLPKMPLIGLVDQEIKTGDLEIDSTILHARKLFFGEPLSMDSKRSACESLCYVLEPLRNDCKILFSGDTETFFNIVNNFDIRHNKNSTNRLQHEEQLEWVFYSLLNTINTFVKMKKKLS